MQTAQLRVYQGRFFLIPASEVEAFDKCMTTLETTSRTSEMSKAQLQYAERFLPYEIQKIDVERLQIEQQANIDAITKAYNIYKAALSYTQGTYNSPVAGSTKLHTRNLHNRQITDISFL